MRRERTHHEEEGAEDIAIDKGRRREDRHTASRGDTDIRQHKGWTGKGKTTR